MQMKNKCIIVVLVALVFATSVLAQTLSPGMYYVNGEDLVRIRQQRGVGVSFGADDSFSNRLIQHCFRGAEATVKTSRTPEFIFVFNPEGRRLLIKGDVFNWKKCKGPGTAFLFYLFQSGNFRIINAYSGSSLLKRRDPRAAYNRMSHEETAPNTYRVTFEDPFEPGEYGFIFINPDKPNSHEGALWPFSVLPDEN